MSFTIKKVPVWAGDILNRPGTLARTLEALSAAGASLEFLIARRVTQNTSRVFVAPLKGAKQHAVAADVGLRIAEGMHALRVEGPDRTGLGAELARAAADGSLNIRGMSAATIGRKSVFYIAFSTAADAAAAAAVLKRALRRKR